MRDDSDLVYFRSNVSYLIYIPKLKKVRGFKL